MAKQNYISVNGKWPEGTNDGRDIIPTEQEAISACKRLYRRAMGKPFIGKFKITSGRRYTWIRNGVFYVNPNQKSWAGNGGWHEIVHMISHIASSRRYNENHGSRHASIERDLIQYVVEQGWLDGKLKTKAAPKPDKKTAKLDSVASRIKKWESKLKRAETALRKLRRTEKRLAA